MHAEILSYSRSRGAFAGVSLEGATLRQDADDNKKIYGREVTPQEILDGSVAVPPAAKGLVAALTRHSSAEQK
jgi:lipid-binding SYLF domain-containing protein